MAVERLWVRVGAKGIILRDRRLLLLRRRNDLDIWPGRWDLPGGGLARGETLKLALEREVREETGFHVRVLAPTHVFLTQIQPRGEGPFESVVACFRCSLRSRAPPQLDPSEHTEFLWAKAGDLDRLRVVPPLRPAMESAFVGLRCSPTSKRNVDAASGR